MNTLAQRIKYARERRGLTQAALADMVGASQQSVNMAEQGKSKRPRFLHELAQNLDVSVDWLLTGRDSGGFPVSNSVVRGAAVADQPVHDAPATQLPVLTVMPSDHVGVYSVSEAVSDFVPRPRQLDGVAQAFAIYVVDDVMAPKYCVGDTLLCHPGKAVRSGDCAVIILKNTSGDSSLTREAIVVKVEAVTDRKLVVGPIGKAGNSFDVYRSKIDRMALIIGIYH